MPDPLPSLPDKPPARPLLVADEVAQALAAVLPGRPAAALAPLARLLASAANGGLDPSTRDALRVDPAFQALLGTLQGGTPTGRCPRSALPDRPMPARGHHGRWRCHLPWSRRRPGSVSARHQRIPHG